MNKSRPPEYQNSSNSNNRLLDLKKLTNIMVRQYLGKDPNNYPRYFYKYLSCDMKDEHIRCLLIDSDFYLSSCIDFNDPFDTTANIIQTGNLKDLRKRFGEIVDKKNPNSNKNLRENDVSRMMKKHADNPEAYKEIFLKHTQAAGIFSLSTNPRDILMWSHYASNHKGMLLQFKLTNDVDSLLHALKMHYSMQYPSLDITKSFEGQFENIMMRKSKHWEYENEWRILRIGGARTFQPFKHEVLTSLVFGCKADDIFKKRVVNILNERESLGFSSIRILKAEMHESKYALKYFKLTS